MAEQVPTVHVCDATKINSEQKAGAQNKSHKKKIGYQQLSSNRLINFYCFSR
jgi:hypothetical protein